MRYFPLLGLLAAGASAQTAPAPAPVQPPAVVMSQVDVTARQQPQLNSIDRKTYQVGLDVQGIAGSAADVLQNIPSVEVDIDGNVSLRGDSNVLVLIDGRPSALMNSTNRGDVLSSMPADSIERIEVITNPSAKYKPDGSAGIINIVLKKARKPGVSGTVRITGGNEGRYGGSVGANYNPGGYNLGGNLNLRKDDRDRITTDRRTYIDPATGLPASTQTVTTERFRPLFEIGEAEVEANAGEAGQISETIDYTDRQQHRHAQESLDSTIGGAASAYDRLRDDPEYERDAESKTSLQHDFGRKDDTLDLTFRWEHDTEVDNNLYTDVFSLPVAPSTYTRELVAFNKPTTEITADYSNTLGPGRKLEAGFDRSDDRWGKNVIGSDFNPSTGLWVLDPTVTNDFVADQIVTAVYGTYQQRFGNFSVLPGLRLESAEIDTNQATQGIVTSQRYNRVYPTLHLAYDLTATGELQLNYSHRINRPDNDDLNPFSEFQDPTSLRVGNPHLKPEQIHSLEAGYQFKNGDTTWLAAIFYRDAYDSFTTVTTIINSATLVTTEENLGHNQSGGVEFAATMSPWKAISLNASASGYYNQVNASNLGYSSTRSATTGSGKLSAEYDWSKSTAVQFNVNYTNRRLTPQGYRLPTFVANIGVKRELARKKLTAFVTVSDIFDSLKEETHLDTPTLHDDYTRRRSSRFFSAGFIYTFGSSKQKPKSDALEFDDKF